MEDRMETVATVKFVDRGWFYAFDGENKRYFCHMARRCFVRNDNGVPRFYLCPDFRNMELPAMNSQIAIEQSSTNSKGTMAEIWAPAEQWQAVVDAIEASRVEYRVHQVLQRISNASSVIELNDPTWSGEDLDELSRLFPRYEGKHARLDKLGRHRVPGNKVYYRWYKRKRGEIRWEQCVDPREVTDPASSEPIEPVGSESRAA
jgi:hypothetical protein